MRKDEFLRFVDDKFSNEEFYNLCLSFMDLVLNSYKFRTEDGNIAGKFYENDIKKAVANVKKYKEKHSIDDVGLQKAIRLYAYNVVSDDDKRQKIYFDQETKGSFKSSNVVGTLYCFTDLPRGLVENIFEIAKG